ncbi:MAG UNVERIFIED_CONTAM: hypothetical protein LVR29_13010 [Microcystis novacekii LVE1205-3]
MLIFVEHWVRSQESGDRVQEIIVYLIVPIPHTPHPTPHLPTSPHPTPHLPNGSIKVGFIEIKLAKIRQD